jgi:myo-inositol-1(or 4)-monophosphatase
MTINDTLATALAEAGEVLLKHLGNIDHFDRKSDIDLVTIADKEAEDLIRQIITAAHPGHQILGEETGLTTSTDNTTRWLVDPVDGTTNFAHAMPIFGTSIAVEKNGEIILAGVFNPATNELFQAEKGAGATLNGKRIQVSSVATLADSLVISGFPYDRRERVHHYLKAWELMVGRVQGLLRLGSAALDLCYIAAGRAEIYWEESLYPWDTAAGFLILEEAGGRVTNFSDERFNPYMKQILATNGLLHNDALEVLAERQRYSEQYCPEECR